MKTLAEQVQSYIDWRSQRDGKPFTPAEMAVEVARRQRGIDRKCGRQDIENLLKKELKRPRYLVELAAAMGTTSEILATGTYTPGVYPPIHMVSEPTPGSGNVISLSQSRHQATDIVIPQYETGGAMGHGLVLREQPGIIKEWRVSQEWIQQNVHRVTAHHNLAIVTGFGPSMQPVFNPGDPLLVDCGVKRADSDGVYFFRVGDEGFVKQLQRIPTAEGLILRAKSYNPLYDPFDIVTGMDFEVFGRIVKIWRGEEF